jgi:hypothetical protein
MNKQVVKNLKRYIDEIKNILSSKHIIFKVVGQFIIVNMFITYTCNSQEHSELKICKESTWTSVYYSGTDYTSPVLFGRTSCFIGRRSISVYRVGARKLPFPSKSRVSVVIIIIIVIILHYNTFGSRGSSVSIVSDYGLDEQGSIPKRGRGFFF